MLTLTVALVVFAAPPQLKPWSGRVPDAEAATITVYAAPDLAADLAPCLADPTITLMNERCRDVPSNAALIASVSREPLLKPLVTAKTDAAGRFKVQVPQGRLFVRVESDRDVTDYVVEPIDGVETELSGGEPSTRDELLGEIARLIDRKAEPADFNGDLWVIGQDNPQLVRLTKDDVAALLDDQFKGPTFLWGCSKVVSASGRLLGTTCPPEKKQRIQLDEELELTGQVLLDGKPKAGVVVRHDGTHDQAKTDAKGRFAFFSVVGSSALVVAESGDLRAAEVIDTTWKERRLASPLTLHLTKEPLPTLHVRDEAGQPLPGAHARFWYRGRVHLGVTDAKGDALAPSSLRTSFLSLWQERRSTVTNWIDLTSEEPVVLRKSEPVEVRFKRADGVLVHQPDVRCDDCEVLDSGPTRNGRVLLAREELPASLVLFTDSVTVTKPGVVVVPRRTRSKPTTPQSNLVVKADDATLQWSTRSGEPEPGRQFVRACKYGLGCQTRQVDVPDAGTITIAPPTEHALEVRTTGFTAGTKMPAYLSLTGPNLESPTTGSLDREGVAHFKRLPPGPWQVAVDYGRPGLWCRAGKPCELDLSAREEQEQRPTLALRGTVPKTVELFAPEMLSERQVPVQKGAVELDSAAAVVIERTTLSVDDGGVRVVQLAPPVDVQVTVLDSKHQPVRDALVSIGLPGPYGWLGRNPSLTNAKGVVSFPKTRPGNLPVRVARAGFAVATTTDTRAKNEVVLNPGKSLTCIAPGIRLPSEVICSAWFDGGQLEGERLRGDRATLRDLPEKTVNVNLEVVERSPISNWVLTQTVDLSKTNEVTFTVPRKGKVLVLDVPNANVTIEGVGRVYCVTLGQSFCETPPIPAGRVTISRHDRESFSFEVPPGEGRVLVPYPETTP